MVDYRRMGNMERRLLVNTTTLTTSLHHPADLWKSPRGTVLRIQALAVVAIIITFFLFAFGLCRRWSNRWIVKKGFFAAQVLSLSLGTYSIGLMQSSSVKSEMYPIWTVALFTLFGCVDPVTSYNGLDYKGQLSKVIYEICLQCTYVLLMSISSISSVVGNTAIGVLSAITLIKGFHRSLALVQQRRMRNMIEELKDDDYLGQASVLTFDFSTGVESARDTSSFFRQNLVIDFPTATGNADDRDDYVRINQVDKLFLTEKKDELQSCYDTCIAYCLCHYLQRHFLGLSSDVPDYTGRLGPKKLKIKGFEGYKRALKVIEIELAFLYDIFFTGNAFLHYYQAKTASLWALASFTGICFVGVAAAIIPSRSSSGGGGSTSTSSFVDTTTADLVITFAILVSLALLQLLQLIRCWTSNWARVAVVCAYARSNDRAKAPPPRWQAWWMRLKASIATSSNWFDKFLWQEEMGQFSMPFRATPRVWVKIDAASRREEGRAMASGIYRGCLRLAKVLGFDYIWEVLRDLLGSDTNKGDAVRLDDEVKAYVIDFLGKMESNRLDGNWKSFPHDPTSIVELYLPYNRNPRVDLQRDLHGYGYAEGVIAWCVFTGCCEEQELMVKKEEDGRAQEEHRRNRRVANVLCNYCAYLVVSAPELLPGSVKETRDTYNDLVLKLTKPVEHYKKLAKDLVVRSDRWETLAHVWVRLLVYAAPYGSPEAHMLHLSQGGEFITHLWALLYHLQIREWRLPSNLHDIITIDHADRILAEFFHGNKSTVKDDAIVVAFLDSPNDLGDSYSYYAQELAAASELERDLNFYQTTSRDVAELFHIDLAAKRPSLILLTKEDHDKFTLLYDGPFRSYAIADFVSVNKKRGRQRGRQSGGHQAEEDSLDGEIEEEEIPPHL